MDKQFSPQGLNPHTPQHALQMEPKKKLLCDLVKGRGELLLSSRAESEPNRSKTFSDFMCAGDCPSSPPEWECFLGFSCLCSTALCMLARCQGPCLLVICLWNKSNYQPEGEKCRMCEESETEHLMAPSAAFGSPLSWALPPSRHVVRLHFSFPVR